ncbi:MAG: hypothetical protein UV61_C0006G0146 [Candidatus Gottesmanbacteria bacterium GW2011_GWB1_43_11]|uniref:Uncharacterized protein n=1 Tax=Candidatus Gottesmanbacteria bacterium GW2011_GWB1_43_11 TaxID=1618446 RepID=A0A0G1CME4_9BACT|nr:MAG: hypothetical protein UV04_C0005G0146 [Candidatus Gottesmanbacteria bacterium GW2011_GWA2_42_16]KKS55671.1 MAG: hypothetical protein UV17_C0008G0022 [Candidatus Gottesmanbacteria bacterium GW2011_GWA1_42_26]KKS81478.1 MAG: hypothetical protein UV55_C0013G0020 [Candidatus Gottesmanbacteria bacterium GW2011_GWC1_43_10]KKS86945.1 MAG: hypothetical protein UV61_C0006G0146 [Candidatus Gottesmanbacteria bacterium GW2011_GWB1_43_11]OGG09517.1 MAG: hypothetical protein A2699_03185 [Candidatus Go
MPDVQLVLLVQVDPQSSGGEAVGEGVTAGVAEGVGVGVATGVAVGDGVGVGVPGDVVGVGEGVVDGPGEPKVIVNEVRHSGTGLPSKACGLD